MFGSILNTLLVSSNYLHCTKICSFPLRIFSVNVTKSNVKLHFLCSVVFLLIILVVFRLLNFSLLQEFGGRWISIERKSICIDRVINECYYVYRFSLKWYTNSRSHHCMSYERISQTWPLIYKMERKITTVSCKNAVFNRLCFINLTK